MGKLTIAYLGNHRTEPGMQESDRFTSECGISNAIESLGHRCIRLNERFTKLPEILTACREADIFLWTRTGGWLQCNGFEMLQRIKRIGIPSVAIHLDLFWGLGRENEISYDPYWSVDLAFTADGGNQDKFKAAGVNHFWLNPGVRKDECYLAEPREDLKCDVAFVGSYNYWENHPRKQLIDWLRETYGPRFRLFGANGDSWRKHALNQLYASAKVTVGDSCFAGKCKNYTSDRLPESLGHGAALCWPVIEGITEEFTEGVHLRLYNAGDYQGLKRTIDDMLAMTDEQRNAMRRAAVAKALQSWTWNHRMQQLLETVAAHEPAIAERLNG